MNQTQTSSAALIDTMSVEEVALAIDIRCRVARHDDAPTIDAGCGDDATSRVVDVVERSLHALQVMSAR